ncbi:hypothetical protein EYF80_013786 [Liparis tanakae]|uniref:Uncharacterized protein n=1 Tax=Liparis tanakae TaxID=230148 RepID=A0A4Z2IFY2_9TELE|nr:hypothetical protein EYF80_013786 [Liparis tanakae]
MEKVSPSPLETDIAVIDTSAGVDSVFRFLFLRRFPDVAVSHGGEEKWERGVGVMRLQAKIQISLWQLRSAGGGG